MLSEEGEGGGGNNLYGSQIVDLIISVLQSDLMIPGNLHSTVSAADTSLLLDLNDTVLEVFWNMTAKTWPGARPRH